MPHRPWVDLLAQEPNAPLLERIIRLVALFVIIAVGIALYVRLETIDKANHRDRIRTQAIACLAHQTVNDPDLARLCESVLAEWRAQDAP